MRTYRALIEELNREQKDKMDEQSIKEVSKETNLTCGNENNGNKHER